MQICFGWSSLSQRPLSELLCVSRAAVNNQRELHRSPQHWNVLWRPVRWFIRRHFIKCDLRGMQEELRSGFFSFIRRLTNKGSENERRHISVAVCCYCHFLAWQSWLSFLAPSGNPDNDEKTPKASIYHAIILSVCLSFAPISFLTAVKGDLSLSMHRPHLQTNAFLFFLVFLQHAFALHPQIIVMVIGLNFGTSASLYACACKAFSCSSALIAIHTQFTKDQVWNKRNIWWRRVAVFLLLLPPLCSFLSLTTHPLVPRLWLPLFLNHSLYAEQWAWW